MIRLKFKYIEETFEIDNLIPYQLIIENPVFFTKILSDIYFYSEETVFFSNDYKSIDFKKKCLTINNIFDLDLNSKKMLMTLYQVMEFKNNDSETEHIINEIDILIANLLENTRDKVDFDFDYKDVLSYKDILSLVELSVVDKTQTLLEKICLYVKIQKQFQDIKVIFFPFIDSFLTEKEILLFIDEMRYNGICVIAILPYDRRISYGKKVIIDVDLCEI